MPVHAPSSRLAALGGIVGGALFAVTGALQATGLDWNENTIETPLQHVTVAFFAAALVAVVPAAAALARSAGRAGRFGWIALSAGQIVVAAASTVSNVRSVDAAWFPAAAVAANLAWIAGTFALAFSLYRTRRVPRIVAVGLVVAYVGAIPLATHGGGIVTGCYWLAVGYLLGAGAIERTPARVPVPQPS